MEELFPKFRICREKVEDVEIKTSFEPTLITKKSNYNTQSLTSLRGKPDELQLHCKNIAIKEQDPYRSFS